MHNPWKDIDDRAFVPMFDENVAIKTHDGNKTTLKAAIFVDGMADPLTDDMMDTEREDMTFVFAKKDWAFVKTLKRGATITRCSDRKQYSISDVKLDNCFGWCITAREK